MAQAYRAPSTTTHIGHTLGSLLWQFWLTHGLLCGVSACVRARMRRGQHALGKARWCQSVELVRDFPRAAKQAQIELYLDERPVIMIKNLVFSVSVAAIFPQMAALLTGSKGGFHGTPLTPPCIRHCSEARPQEVFASVTS